MLHVDRRAGSAVSVQVSRSPIQRYLDGARSYAVPDRLPPDVQARIVPAFCRNAVEAAAANLVRRRAAEQGGSLLEADERLEEARTLRETLALALFDDAGRAGRGRQRRPRPLRDRRRRARHRAQPRRPRRARPLDHPAPPRPAHATSSTSSME